MTRFTEWKITAKAVVLAAGVSALVAGGLAARPTQLVERTAATTDVTVPDPACVPYHCDPYPDGASTTTTTSPVPAEVPVTLAPATVVERTVVERVTIVEKRLEAVEATTTTTQPAPVVPTGLTATFDAGQLVITWDPVPDATGYTLMVNGAGQSAACCEARLPAPAGEVTVKLASSVPNHPSPGTADWAAVTVTAPE